MLFIILYFFPLCILQAGLRGTESKGKDAAPYL